MLITAIYLGRVLFSVISPRLGVSDTTSWGAIFHYIGGWDASLYVLIARNGYVGAVAAAFPPLLPMLEHIALTVGINPTLAGILISNVAFFLALGCLRVLVEREWGGAVAHRTALYLALFPTAFFFDIGYTEALFLLLSVAAFLALRRHRWVLTGVFAGLAVLARDQGILLLLPIALELYTSQIRPRLRSGQRMLPPLRSLLAMCMSIALPIATYLGFTLYLAARYGTPFEASRAEEGLWGKGLAIPFIGFARAGGALLHLGFAPNWFQAHILIDMAFAVLLIALAVATWRWRQPLPYVIYALATMLLLFALPRHGWQAFASDDRYMLTIFPLFVALGQWGQRREVEQWILAVSVPLLVLFTLIFLAGGWIA